MYVTEPSVSTAGSRRIRACLATIFRAPRARVITTTAGSASGIAATARLTAVMNISSASSPRAIPAMKTIHADPERDDCDARPKDASRRCSGVFTSPAVSSIVAIFPNSVAMPVATATRPRPYVTTVPL